MKHYYGTFNLSARAKESITKNRTITFSEVCFGQLANRWYHPEDNFSFAFNINKDVAEKFCEEFNSIFVNIKLKVLDSFKYYRYSDDLYGNICFLEPQENREAPKTNCACSSCRALRNIENDFTVLTCEFNNNYSANVRYVFYPIIGELVRIFDAGYTIVFNGEIATAQDLEKIKRNPFTYAWKIDQQNLDNCTLLKFDFESLLKFDDISFVNEIFSQDYSDDTFSSESYDTFEFEPFGTLCYPTVALEIIEYNLRNRK